MNSKGFVTQPPRKIHELKILPEYFRAVVMGAKRFEVRKDDIQVRDIVNLKEFDSEKGYTGHEILVEITYILRDKEYCKEGYVIFSFNRLYDYSA